jgi:EAL domain-containing protein (putative c-di-GMP-specific phosphodiesterase class I)
MRGWPMLLIVAVCACLAVGCAVYVLSGGTEIRIVIAALSLAIGLSLAAVMIGNYAQSSQVSRHFRQLRNDMRLAERGTRDSHNRTEYLATQLLEVRQRTEQVSGAIMAGLNELKESHVTLADHMRAQTQPQARSETFQYRYTPEAFEPAATQARVQPLHASFASPFPSPQAANAEPPPFAERMKAPAPPPAPETSVMDQLSTSLEPIVDLFTGKTSHYRLHLGMTKPDGEEVSSHVLLHHADRTGLRAGFDVHAAHDAYGLLRRLRQRDGVLNIFLPLGAASLQSEQSISRLVQLRSQFPDVADGLVLEVPHAVLAGLTESGLEGLAELARHGHSLSLTNVSVGGIDLPALAKLNVRYVTLNVAAATGAEGPPQHIQTFAQSARAMRVHVIVTDVSDMKMTPFVSKISRFASGTAFAEPRKVKADAARATPASYSAVA